MEAKSSLRREHCTRTNDTYVVYVPAVHGRWKDRFGDYFTVKRLPFDVHVEAFCKCVCELKNLLTSIVLKNVIIILVNSPENGLSVRFRNRIFLFYNRI